MLQKIGAGLRAASAWAKNRSYCCISGDSERLITASGDSSVRLWEMETGLELFQWKLQEPCRALRLSVGEHLAAFSTDPFQSTPPGMHIIRICEELADQTDEQLLSMDLPTRIYRLAWTEQNRVIITAQEDGFVRRWDVEVCDSQTVVCLYVCQTRVFYDLQ